MSSELRIQVAFSDCRGRCCQHSTYDWGGAVCFDCALHCSFLKGHGVVRDASKNAKMTHSLQLQEFDVELFAYFIATAFRCDVVTNGTVVGTV